jgi:16S rRNA C967 or C1407 C5-methylase (RsmB/RsmF family)
MTNSVKTAKLSQDLATFYDCHNVNLSSILDESSTTRFIRINPRFDAAETLGLLPDARPIPWLHDRFGFYAIPSSIKLRQSECFRSGRVYGMDVSSGVAIAVLLTTLYDKEQRKSDCQPPLRVLDLCCAPGLKLCMLADLLFEANPSSTVVGVDVSQTRISLCKAIVKKYHVDPVTSGKAKMDSGPSVRVRLYCEDGRTFGMKNSECVFDSLIAVEEQRVAGKRKRTNKSARAREQQKLKMLDSSSQTDEDNSASIKPFDYVLIDAECSTDGSLKHVKEQLKRANGAIENLQLTNDKQLEELVQLQRGLLASGYRLLSPGGILVYSTCSLSSAQNEGVVQWLLDGEHDACLIPLDFGSKEDFIVQGSIAGTVRFVPRTTNFASGGGFFVAKITKRTLKTTIC